MQIVEVVAEKGSEYEIQVAAVKCGDDWNVTICGGSRHHVGAVAIACKKTPDGTVLKHKATVSSFSVLDHKDDIVARKMSVFLADRMNTTVTVTAGIHIDDATIEELIMLQENCVKACEELIEKISQAG